MCSKHNIHKGIGLLQCLDDIRLLHHAAAQHDHHLRILLFQAIQIAETTIDLLIGIFPDGTGIVDDHIGIFLPLRLLISGILQNSQQFFGILSVHLTAHSQVKYPQRMSETLCLLLYQLPQRRNKIILSSRFLLRNPASQINIFYLHRMKHISVTPFGICK